MNPANTKKFIETKVRALIARARRLSILTPDMAGLRPKDRAFAPSAAHFAASNRRLKTIDRKIAKRIRFLKAHWRTARPQRTLVYIALLEREVDRARRTFGMLFEVFSQRGSVFAPALAAHDAIAADCYAAVRKSAPRVFDRVLLKPLTYMEHGYSPATMRRGVSLARLLGDRNPFPLIRIPWDRDNPWQSVFLHEVAHNLQADLRVWHENKEALTRRLLKGKDPMVTATYSRWHKEIFADLAALLLGGTASAWGMMDFLAHPSPKILTYKPGGAHPTGYVRALILSEMLRRMGFEEDAVRARKLWRSLYNPARGHRLPPRLVDTADQVIPHVVDEIAFQPRRNLAQRALADVIQFRLEDEAAIRKGAIVLARGQVPQDLPPRFLVSASRVALSNGAPAGPLSDLVINHLSRQAAVVQARPIVPRTAAA